MSTLGIDDRGRCALRQHFNGKLQLPVVGLHLAFMHSLNASH